MAAHPAPHHGDGAAAAHEGHVLVPVSLYLKVFGVLMILLLITVGAAMVDLGPLNLPIAVTIAVVKAVFILLYFMHLRWSTRLIWVFSAAGFFWLGIMFVMALSDYMARGALRAG